MKKILFAFAATIAFVSCGNKSEVKTEENEVKTEEKAEEKSDSAKVEVDAVSSATNVANSPTFNGLLMVEPSQHATVSVTMGGRIHSLNVMSGKAVARGQVIATLDNPEFIELQQTWLESSAQLEYLEKEYARQKSLAQDAASKKRVEESKAEYLSMKSKADAAATKLQALGVSAKSVAANGIRPYLPVVSPISGYVTDFNTNLGKYVAAGEAICDVINKSQPMIQLTVYEKDIKLMEIGGKLLFRVNGMGKQSFPATIISIDQAVDEKDYSIKVYAKVKEANSAFRPGMYVRTKLVNVKE